jgi:hypothetical protein
MNFSVTETVVEYDPRLRLSWKEGGSWPHSNHYGFHETVVAAHFTLLGYHAFYEYSVTKDPQDDSRKDFNCRVFRSVVGDEVAVWLRTAFGTDDTGQPDLFVYRDPDNPNDPKIRYSDPLLWLWVEVKGVHSGQVESVRGTQKAFWRLIASHELLGPERIRLVRAIPKGSTYQPRTISY